MDLSNLLKPKWRKRAKTRVGRGMGSGHGGHTALRGQKGQKSRTGGKIPLRFEGGQLPLVKRLPHVKGFKPLKKVSFTVVNTSLLNSLKVAKTQVITPKYLVKEGLIKSPKSKYFKILKDEEVNKPLKLAGFRYSKKALESIKKAGGDAK